MIYFILIILVLLSSVLVESFMPSTDEMLLTLDCDSHENNKSFMFNFNITSSNEDLDKTYIQNNKSNESMNRWYHIPCNVMQSFISRLCINKSKCLIKLNDFINSNDRCVDGKKNLSIQFLCGSTSLSSSSLSLPSSSSSQEFTNTKVTYIFTLNTLFFIAQNLFVLPGFLNSSSNLLLCIDICTCSGEIGKCNTK